MSLIILLAVQGNYDRSKQYVCPKGLNKLKE